MHVLLASYPRSGNTWTRYVVEILTGQATRGYSSNIHLGPPLINKDKEAVCTKSHDISKRHLEDFNKVILLLRNPKECLPRHGGDIYEALTRQGCGKDGTADGYLYLIDEYRKIKCEKDIIYYEDLITNQISAYQQIADIFEVELGNFMDNIVEHKTNSLKLYPLSKTKGLNIHYHEKHLTKDMLSKINSVCENYKELERYV